MTVSIFDSITTNVGAAFLKRRPVYWRGTQIGYADFLKNGTDAGMTMLCNGTMETFVGVDTGDPREWTTFNLWGQSEPITSYCLDHGIMPKWLTPEQRAAAKQDVVTGKVMIPGVTASSMPSLPLILAGGAAALGLVLMLARR